MNRRLAVIMVADLAGYSCLMEENPSAAIAQVRRSQTDPWLPRRLFLLALAETLDGRFEDAQTNVSEALELQPDRSGFWRLLAHINTELGDMPGAQVAQERASCASPEPHVMVIELALPGKGAELMAKFAPAI